MTATFEPIAPRTRKGTPKITRTEHIMDLFEERLVAPPRVLDSLPFHESKDSMSFRGDKLIHYGHFTLAHIIRDGRRRVKLVLLNGDTYSSAGFGPSTSDRQSDIRGRVQRSGRPYLVVPFSALSGAEIELESIVPVEVRPDRTTYYDVIVDERPGAHPKKEHPDGLTHMVEEQRHGWHDRETGAQHVGGYPTAEERERLDYGPFTVQVERPVMVDDTERANVDARPTHGWVRDHAVKQADGRWKYQVERHWLGDAVFKAKSTQWRGAKRRSSNGVYLSSFDYGEPHRPYFLCELPRSFKGSTVDDAIDSLMPDEVRAAVASGLDVVRQGDIFAIPTSVTTKELESRAKPATRTFEHWTGQVYTPEEKVEKIRRFKADGRWTPGACDIHGTNHSATALIVTNDGEQYGRGRLYHTPAESWRTPDHRVVTLGDGKTWYRLVKNTVPLAKGQRGSHSGLARQSGQSRAWTIGGMVD